MTMISKQEAASPEEKRLNLVSEIIDEMDNNRIKKTISGETEKPKDETPAENDGDTPGFIKKYTDKTMAAQKEEADNEKMQRLAELGIKPEAPKEPEEPRKKGIAERFSEKV